MSTDRRRQFCAIAAISGLALYACCDLLHVCYCGHFRHPPYALLDTGIDLLWGVGLLLAAVSAVRAEMRRKPLFIMSAILLITLRLAYPGALLEIPVAALLLALAAANLRGDSKRAPRLAEPIPLILLFLVGLVSAAAVRDARAGTPPPGRSVQAFVDLFSSDPVKRDHALCRVRNAWEDRFTPMILEVMRVPTDRGFNSHLLLMLQEETGQDLGLDANAWFEWVWDQQLELHPHYADFKAALYSRIDSHFARYFGSERTATIRLDEVRWGGVIQNGIPPLREPATTPSERASYLADSDIVFGVELNGAARAYPKRILAHHELVLDEIGGVSIAGVYCTLCGSMIVYETVADGVHHELGTSGFLYRSNKLMFDERTQSLWSTLQGRPVIGPLADSDIVLTRRSVVTTTWGEWRRRHPLGDVITIPVDYQRDYAEGAAYREYFATDALMFNVPLRDTRLKNKDEIVGLVIEGRPETAIAISTTFLAETPVYHDTVGSVRLVVLTDRTGAARVYETPDVEFASFDGRTVIDNGGTPWALGESALTSANGRTLPRFPSHRAFWFGWRAAYESTRLVQ